MAEQRLVYVGTYTQRGSEGIYIYRFDPDTGALHPVSKAAGLDNPSFLDIHPTRRYLYAVNEVRGKGRTDGGAVSAFAIDPKTGDLTFLNRQSAHGASTCHVSVEQTGRFVLAANYSSGSVVMLPIQEDGQLGEATALVQHEGSSVDPRRQKGPHAHSITPGPFNRFAFAADLGLDKIIIYRLDLDEGKLLPNDPPWARIHPGAGPRHFTFHPNRRYAYVINELDNTMVAFKYDKARGALEELQSITTLPGDFKGTSYCADVHVSPSGKFLYGSNRGHNSIAIFAIDEATGTLTPVGHEPTQGDHPRNFMIDPTGAFLLVANQNADNIVAFRIDPATGLLQPTGHITNVSMPVCLKMMTLSA
ncbi:MAG: lactonase family protein [Planctomycetes bacterium]|nr:lactonase family protein [Planctomycetota bacterium]